MYYNERNVMEFNPYNLALSGPSEMIKKIQVIGNVIRKIKQLDNLDRIR